jgi:hypothetical protein
MKAPSTSSNGKGKSSSLAGLEQMLGSSSSLDLGLLDATLVWMTITSVLRKGAAITLALNKSGSSVIITLYDGDYPHKEFCEGIERTHFVLAAIVQHYGKEAAKGEWFEYLQQFGIK